MNKTIERLETSLTIARVTNTPLAHLSRGDAEIILALLKDNEPIVPKEEQDSMVCSLCGHDVIWKEPLGDGTLGEERVNFCPRCGRAIEWN